MIAIEDRSLLERTPVHEGERPASHPHTRDLNAGVRRSERPFSGLPRPDVEELIVEITQLVNLVTRSGRALAPILAVPTTGFPLFVLVGVGS